MTSKNVVSEVITFEYVFFGTSITGKFEITIRSGSSSNRDHCSTCCVQETGQKDLEVPGKFGYHWIINGERKKTIILY